MTPCPLMSPVGTCATAVIDALRGGFCGSGEGVVRILRTVPHPPNLELPQPYTTRPMPSRSSAAAHMMQGSTVTYLSETWCGMRGRGGAGRLGGVANYSQGQRTPVHEAVSH